MEDHTYKRNFAGNVLVVGWTACGKTFFVQRLAINNFFGTLKNVEWISSIQLDKDREAEIGSSFLCEIDFHHPKDKNSFDSLLEQFKARSKTVKKLLGAGSIFVYGVGFGEKSVRDWLIVMDDVSGLADSSKKFACF